MHQFKWTLLLANVHINYMTWYSKCIHCLVNNYIFIYKIYRNLPTGLFLVLRLGMFALSFSLIAWTSLSLFESLLLLRLLLLSTSVVSSSMKSFNEPSESERSFFSFAFSIFSAFRRRTKGCVQILCNAWKSAKRVLLWPIRSL